jgi:hypothetical protein
MIDNLQDIDDPLIRKFDEQELRLIKENSAFHSPEASETDTENPNGKRKITVKNLKWRSSTVRLFIIE